MNSVLRPWETNRHFHRTLPDCDLSNAKQLTGHIMNKQQIPTSLAERQYNTQK